MKGIILAGGSGTRLYPTTMVTSKQLLPVYDKPMIYYPLSVLMLAEIKDILIITTEKDMPDFKKLLGDGARFGIHLSYKTQKEPNGLAEAFIIGKDFIGNDCATLILGDNIFFGPRFSGTLKYLTRKIENEGGACIFAYPVKHPERFGIVEFDEHNNILSLEEKPQKPKSNYAVTGLYIYDNKVIEYAKNLKPSARGELEITDINRIYLYNHTLRMEKLGRGFSWLDTGTPSSLLQAGQYIQTIEENQGIKMACLEEVAFRMGFMSKNKILKNIKGFKNNEYFDYVRKLVRQ
ncbi:MAG: glucose-1-phosphate thymidylyltransferase RfbA [Cyanobacteriota bacterium]|nr:glucose-1-phosphate thymidylyltransferase RfbA [Cyanobacteriota bacterium]